MDGLAPTSWGPGSARRPGPGGTLWLGFLRIALQLRHQEGLQRHRHPPSTNCCRLTLTQKAGCFGQNSRHFTCHGVHAQFQLWVETAGKWDIAFRDYLKELDQDKPVVCCGDSTVAHREIDLARPQPTTTRPLATPSRKSTAWTHCNKLGSSTPGARQPQHGEILVEPSRRGKRKERGLAFGLHVCE